MRSPLARLISVYWLCGFPSPDRGLAAGGIWSVLGWAGIASVSDPLEQDLVEQMQQSSLESRALSTWCDSYVGIFKRFVAWCKERSPPRIPLPASGDTVALYLQFVGSQAKVKDQTYAVVKSTSGAIFAFHELALVKLEENPTKCVRAGCVM